MVIRNIEQVPVYLRTYSVYYALTQQLDKDYHGPHVICVMNSSYFFPVRQLCYPSSPPHLPSPLTPLTPLVYFIPHPLPFTTYPKQCVFRFTVWTYIWGTHEGSRRHEISQRRISSMLRKVAPSAHNERAHDLLDRTNPVPYYASYFGYKLDMDQNEKLAQEFGITHVHALDGCSRMVLGCIIIPKKNSVLIYQYLFRQVLLLDLFQIKTCPKD